MVRGNHDIVIAGIEDGSGFQNLAHASAMWSRLQIRPDNRAYLGCMSQGPVTLENEIQISHGSPHDEDFYILSHWDARSILHRSESWIAFYGHTHLPMIYSTESKFLQCYPEGDEFYYELSEDKQYLINPGSVGQPRDLNPQASFAILDTATNIICVKRIGYDIQSTQRKIREAGLPTWHAERLVTGR